MTSNSNVNSNPNGASATVTVREATPSDAEAVRRVHRASILELGPEAYTREQVEAWAAGCATADYEASIESDETYVVVAESREDGADDGTTALDDRDHERAADLVGFGSLSLTLSHSRESVESNDATADAEVTGVYVHPSVVRTGVGSTILSTLERRARTHDVETLELSASLNAVAFYESHGFERVREETHEFSANRETGVEGRVAVMRKRL